MGANKETDKPFKKRAGGKTIDPNRMLEIKIGGFVLAGVIAASLVVFLLGQEKHLFEEQVLLHSQFKDVAGLRDGAPVRLSGVTVGTVTRVAFEKNLNDPRIKVDFEVTRNALERIRKDSTVRIGGEGLLGDKIVEISIGSPEEPRIEPNGMVASQDAPDLNKVAEKAAEVMDKFKIVAENAAAVLEGLGDPKTVSRIQGAVASARDILQSIEKGPGLAHSVFYERESSDLFASTLREFNQVAAATSGAIRRIEKILAATDERGMQLINHASIAAKNIGEAAKELNHAKIVSNLGQASADLASVSRYIRTGKGSVGGIIADPTIYHKLVSIVGGVERSKILRAVVRYAIGRNDEQSTPVVGLQSDAN